MKHFKINLLIALFCIPAYIPANAQSNNTISQYVNPMLGTKNMGHTFPGATVPFGMVQLSPATSMPPLFINEQYNPEAYRYCSGYQYDDSTIFGFAHTHFSGTGHSDLGDFLIMPSCGSVNLEPGNPKKDADGFYSTFAHATETAKPGYYSVILQKYAIKAELTASERVGFHQYIFNSDENPHIIFDLMYGIYNYNSKNVWTFIRVENDSLVTGYRQTTGWGRTRVVYFAMQFSKAFTSYGHKKYDQSPYKGFYRKFNETENFPEIAGRDIRVYFCFDQTDTLKIKFALSGVSASGALLNLNTEMTHWNFEKAKKQAIEKWNKELSSVQITALSDADMETFYTALYHTMLSPIIYEDVNGSYRGLDQEIHQSDGFTNYTVFSLWDTYRALHPWLNLIKTSKNNDMIHSMLAHFEQSVHPMLPVWSHYANENWCMIGYHAVSVIADAVVKSNINFDVQQALQACVKTANCSYFDGIDQYIKQGFIAENQSPSSVSKVLEYAYDDWCIAQIANACEQTSLKTQFLQRSEHYKHHFDKKSGFMRPKDPDGNWKKEFDPLDTHGQGFIEGNAWNYSLYLPHQTDSLIRLMGGKKRFTEHLDSLFTMKLDDRYIEKNEDITRDGIIGNYVHGNEPSHHVPYLYNFAGAPWKTQYRVREIMAKMYSNGPDGLCGNDDCGQMSAWYVFSALGFYPVCPGSDRYEIGSPSVNSANILLENGKIFKIITHNQSMKNVYVQKIILNGKKLNRGYITHKEIIDGGVLEFYLSNKPAKN